MPSIRSAVLALVSGGALLRTAVAVQPFSPQQSAEAESALEDAAASWISQNSAMLAQITAPQLTNPTAIAEGYFKPNNPIESHTDPHNIAFAFTSNPRIPGTLQAEFHSAFSVLNGDYISAVQFAATAPTTTQVTSTTSDSPTTGSTMTTSTTGSDDASSVTGVSAIPSTGAAAPTSVGSIQRAGMAVGAMGAVVAAL